MTILFINKKKKKKSFNQKIYSTIDIGKQLYILKKISDGLYLQFTYFCHGNSEHRTSVPVAQWQRQRHRAMLEVRPRRRPPGIFKFF